jgi:PRC-barrel domain
MRWQRRVMMAAVAPLVLLIAMGVSFGENDELEHGAPAKGNPASPEVTILDWHEVEGILGRDVRSATDENMGRVVDVLVDHSGQVRAAIIDFGGFLGVGSRKIAVDWNALHFPPPGKPGGRITLELNRDQVNAAPAYQEGKPVVILGALGEPLSE